MTLSLHISPCPNDTFMFDALVNGRIDCGDLRIAEGETSTYYADSDWYSNVSYRVFEFDTGVLTWDEEGVFYRME